MVQYKPVLRLRSRATTIGASQLSFQPDAPRRGSIPSLETLPEDGSQITLAGEPDEAELQPSKPLLFFNSKRTRAATTATYYDPPRISLQPPDNGEHEPMFAKNRSDGETCGHLGAPQHVEAHKRLSIQIRRRSTSLPLAPLVIPDASTAPDFAVDYAAFVQKQSADCE